MADTNERTPLLKVEHLSKEFPAESGMFAKRFSKRVVSAVNDISFEIYPGEIKKCCRDYRNLLYFVVE